MYKWILFLMIPAIAFGQWRSDSYDNPNATSSSWGDISKAPFKIRGVNVGAGDLSVLFSVNPLKPDSTDYSIILRVGDRAQSTGDSRMGIYSSSWINTHRNPALESQAIYGINLYRGDSLDGKDGYDATATQIGVHGIAQARYGATDSAAGLVGVQGFASSFSDGHINWMYGGSFNAQGGDPSNASIGTLGGVRANAYVEGYDTVSQASAFIGMAPTISSMLGGQIIHAWTAQLEQPSVGTTSNYALIFTDPTPLTGDDDISIGFKDSSGSIKTFSFDQRTHEFQILRYLTIYEPLDGLTSYLKLVHGDTAGVGESNSGIYFTAQDSVDVGAANQYSIVHRWGNGNNQLEFIKGSNIVFSIYPTYLLANSPLYKYAFLADSQYVTKKYADGLGGGVSLTDVGNYIDSTQLDTIQYAHKAVFADSADNVTDRTIDSADIGSGVIYNPHIANSTITPFKLNDVNTQTDLMLLGQDTATTNFRWYWIDELLGLEPNATTGYVLHINKEADPDSLYWALAGGSGNPIKVDTGGVLTLVDSLIVEAGNDIDLAVDIAAGFDKLTIKLDTTGFISLADFPDSVLCVVRDSLGGTSTRTDNYVLKVDVTPNPDTFYWAADNTGGGTGWNWSDSSSYGPDSVSYAAKADSAGKASNDGAGNSITGTYATITNVGKIGDDTTSLKAARDTVAVWDNGAYPLDDSLIGAGEAFALYESKTNVAKIGDDTTNFKLAKDSVDAWDNGILARKADPRYFSASIALPDSIQVYVPDFKLFHVKDMLFPSGIVIDSVEIQLDADAAYSMVFEEWSGADPPVYENAISTVTTGATDTHAIEAPDTDGTINAGDWIVLDIPTTDVPFVNVGIYYHRQ